MSVFDDWTRIFRLRLEPRLPHDRPRNVLFLMKGEMEKVMLQFARLGDDKTRANSVFSEIGAQGAPLTPQQEKALFDVTTALNADVHFLLVSMRGLNKLLWRLQGYLPEEPELKEIRERYKSVLRKANEFRNHLEHVDEELDRGVHDFGRLDGTIFSFDGEKIDIGPSLRAKTESLFREVLDACEAIANRQNK